MFAPTTGRSTIVQPLIAPLYGGKSAHEVRRGADRRRAVRLRPRPRVLERACGGFAHQAADRAGSEPGAAAAAGRPAAPAAQRGAPHGVAAAPAATAVRCGRGAAAPQVRPRSRRSRTDAV